MKNPLSQTEHRDKASFYYILDVCFFVFYDDSLSVQTIDCLGPFMSSVTLQKNTYHKIASLHYFTLNSTFFKKKN